MQTAPCPPRELALPAPTAPVPVAPAVPAVPSSEAAALPGLTPRQLRVLQALVAGESVASVARAHQVSERTVRLWRRHPAFEAAFREAQAQLMQETRDLLASLGGEAVRALAEAWRNPYATDSTRVAAAGKLLSLLFRNVPGEAPAPAPASAAGHTPSLTLDLTLVSSTTELSIHELDNGPRPPLDSSEIDIEASPALCPFGKPAHAGADAPVPSPSGSVAPAEPDRPADSAGLPARGRPAQPISFRKGAPAKTRQKAAKTGKNRKRSSPLAAGSCR
jgi:hypothetical protein